MLDDAAVIVPVVLCGGCGDRLWPLSTPNNPKQFMSFGKSESFLQQTLRRVITIFGRHAENTVIVTLDEYRVQAQSQTLSVTDIPLKILVEPYARNTAPAIAMAAVHVKNTYGANAVMVVIPADHYIGDLDALAAAFECAIGAAGNGKIITFGILPDRPETGYGYIRRGGLYSDGLYTVSKFIEKPDRGLAQSFLNQGNYYWNSGMFVFRAGNILTLFREYASDIFEAVQKLSCAGYEDIPQISFDRAILERGAQALVVPCAFAWSDVGSWAGILRASAKDADGNAAIGEAVFENAKGCFVYSSEGRKIILRGVDDLAVVETPNEIFITYIGRGEASVSGVDGQGASIKHRKLLQV